MLVPQLSIIVPVYNVEKYLRRCVDSLLSQNYKDIEIILVDDGSTDSSGDICDEYQKKSDLIHVIHQKNQGLSGARNTGLEVAAGKYIGFVDSDDWVEPDFYTFMIQTAFNNKSDVVSGTFQRIENAGQIKEIDRTNVNCEILTGEKIYCKYLSSAIQGGITHVPVCSKIYNRKVLEGIRFDAGALFEDIAFNWRVIGQITSSCVFCDYSGYYYFVNKKSITKSLQNKFNYKLLDYPAAAEEIKEIYVGQNGSNAEVLRLLNVFICRTHYSVLFKMIQSKCPDVQLVNKEIGIVKANFSLLWRSSMSPTRKLLLLFFKVITKRLLARIILTKEEK